MGWNRLTEGMDDQAAKCLNLHGVEFDDSGNLIGLDLSNLEIIGLPDTIGDLKNLQNLNLQECMSLTGLPVTIGDLKNLQNLDLRLLRSYRPARDRWQARESSKLEFEMLRQVERFA